MISPDRRVLKSRSSPVALRGVPSVGRTVSDPAATVSARRALDPYAMWRQALAEADRVFANPPTLDRPVYGCTHRTPESDLRLLGGDPAAVPDEVLGDFVREVADHWDKDQYPLLWRRLIPRALRSWGPDGTDIDPAREIGHLGRDGADFTTWPAPEHAAVEQAFRALLTLALIDGRSLGGPTDLIEGIAHATGDLLPWPDHLATAPGPQADAALVRLAFDWATDLLWEDFGSGPGTTATRRPSRPGSPPSAPASPPSPPATVRDRSAALRPSFG